MIGGCKKKTMGKGIFIPQKLPLLEATEICR